ncbi:MAG: PAS domain-containing protein, partial [Thermostichus sp. BF3_bins_97]
MPSSPYRLVPVKPGDNRFYPEHLHLALEATQLGYWQMDLRSWQLSTSPQCKAKYGWDPDQDFTLEMFLDCIHPEDRERVLKAFQAVSSSDPNFSVEYRCYWADRQLRWNLSMGIALGDRQGKPQQIVGVTLDISERKQTELKLQKRIEREQVLNQLVQAINASLDLPTLFEVAVQQVGRVLQAARVTLYQYLPGEGVWVGIASHRESADLPSTLNLRVPDTHEFRVIDHLKRLQVFCVQDPEQAADSSPNFQTVLREKHEHQLGPW